MIGLPNLPPAIMNLIISEGIRFQRLQIDFFRSRAKVGPMILPAVFQPSFEPKNGHLVAAFIAPGEVHLVFHDEVAPNEIFDEKYREQRKKSLGRTADVESVELSNGTIHFPWCGVIPLNPYEFGLHPSTIANYDGKVYSCTWNHMMASTPQLFITLRGGYVKVDPLIYRGNRDDAEDYAKKL